MQAEILRQGRCAAASSLVTEEGRNERAMTHTGQSGSVASAATSSKTKLPQDLFEREAVVFHDFAQNRTESAGTQRVVIRNGEMMLATGLGGEPTVRANLPREFIAKGAAQRLFKFTGGKIARELHAVASSSSMTR